MTDVVDVPDAVDFLQGLVKCGALCHASGSRTASLRYGYFIYALVPKEAVCEQGRKASRKQEEALHQAFPYRGNMSSFNEDWVQVEVSLSSDTPVTFAFACSDTVSSASPDRPEWAHFHYQRLRRRATSAATFELGLHWTVATGSCLAEQVQGWARKAAQCGFALIPIPGWHFYIPNVVGIF